MNKNIMEWSREIINSIMKKKNDSKYSYTMQIVLKPNPLDYDGIDEVLIEIFEEKQGAIFTNEGSKIFTKNRLAYVSPYCMSIEEAMVEIDKLLK